MNSLITVSGVEKVYGAQRRWIGPDRGGVRALRGIDFSVVRGQTLGIVGESGCGKSTLARILVGLEAPTAGEVSINESATRIQYIFQNPQASLNPRKTIRQALEQPLLHLRKLHRQQCREEIQHLLDAVQLPQSVLERYPHEFSGGQAQRIVIARALASAPEILVLDEPVSALDVSVQAQILNLLTDLRESRRLTYLFISHDMSVVKHISEQLLVMYFGSVVEWGATDAIFKSSRHPYTRMLLDSVPKIGQKPAAGREESGELPDPAIPLKGCAFAGRCQYQSSRCLKEIPRLANQQKEHDVACFNPLS